jgi:hypothetical protein
MIDPYENPFPKFNIEVVTLKPQRFSVHNRLHHMDLKITNSPSKLIQGVVDEMVFTLETMILGRTQVYTEKVPLTWWDHLLVDLEPRPGGSRFRTWMYVHLFKRFKVKYRTIKVEAGTLAPDFLPAPNSLGKEVKVMFTKSPPEWSR